MDLHEASAQDIPPADPTAASQQAGPDSPAQPKGDDEVSAYRDERAQFLATSDETPEETPQTETTAPGEATAPAVQDDPAAGDGAPAEETLPAAPASASKTPDDDDPTETGGGKRFRVQATGPIEERALELRKRNRDLSLEECLTRAKAELGVSTQQEDPNAPKLPQSLDEARTALTDLRTRRKKALGEDMDFATAAQLDEEIETLRDHMEDLRDRETSEAQSHRAAFIERVEASKTRAVELYADVAVADSALCQRMVQIDQDLQDNDDPLYFSPDKPLKLAQMAAADLGIAPKSKAATAQPQPSAPKPEAIRHAAPKPAPVVPASGNARTTSTTQPKAGQLEAEIDRVTDVGDYKSLVKGL